MAPFAAVRVGGLAEWAANFSQAEALPGWRFVALTLAFPALVGGCGDFVSSLALVAGYCVASV
jgi:hypothetical protein